MGRLRRDAWPVPLGVWLVENLLPVAIALAMVAALAWGTTPDLFGVIPWTDIMLAATTVAVLAGIAWPPLRSVVLAAVTVSELGLAMTLLFVGSEVEALPRGAELLGASVHTSLWLSYCSAHLLADMVRHLHQLLGQAGLDLERGQ